MLNNINNMDLCGKKKRNIKIIYCRILYYCLFVVTFIMCFWSPRSLLIITVKYLLHLNYNIVFIYYVVFCLNVKVAIM